MYLSEAQPEGVGYLWNSSECHPASANTLTLMSQGNLLDSTQCGLGVRHNTRIWQNLLPRDNLEAEHARLRPSTHQVDAALKTAGLSNWSTFPSLEPGDQLQPQYTPPREPLPYMGNHLNTVLFRVQNGTPGRSMLFVSGTPASASREVREALMGFHIGDTAAPGLSAL